MQSQKIPRYKQLDEEFISLCGVPLRVFEFVVAKWNNNKDAHCFFLAMMKMHLNLSVQQLRFISSNYLTNTFAPQSDMQTLRFIERGMRFAPKERYNQPTSRFFYEENVLQKHFRDAEKNIPLESKDEKSSNDQLKRHLKSMKINWLIDGVPFLKRGGIEDYNDKNKDKSTIMQGVCNLLGRPISWSNGLPGSITDAVAANNLILFPGHTENDVGLADLMYQCNAHCITASKKPNGESMTDGMRRLDDLVKIVRTRIEHVFARLDRHRILRHCQHRNQDFYDDMFNFMMHLECACWDAGSGVSCLRTGPLKS